MKPKNIENFFLNTVLIISMSGVLLVLLSNLLFFPEDKLSIFISVGILVASIIAYLLRTKYPTIAVVLVTSVALAAMCYQRLTVPNTSTTLSVVMIVGFVFSVMLRGKVMWVMHGIAFIIINTIFVFHQTDAITAAVTYSTLYFILAYAAGALKFSYDNLSQYLIERNIELINKSDEIAVQNQELIKIQANLSALNADLEKVVNERTARIQAQNEILIKYSYTNAHHLRGPVARLLGLASIYQLDSQPNPDFFIQKMVEQANEIDSVISRINSELEASDAEVK